MRLLNPLQWNFGPRTTATLLTWAIVPLLLGGFVTWRSLVTGAAAAGLTDDQVTTLIVGVIRPLAIVTVPLLVICLLAAILFSWVMIQPLWRLRKGMEAIARGDLSQCELPVQSRDEVGQITQSFNAMAAALKAMVQDVAHTAADLDAAGTRLSSAAGETARATEATTRQIEQVRSVATSQADQAAGGTRASSELREAAEQVASSADAQAEEVTKVATTVQQVAAAIEQVASGAGVVSEAAARTKAAADAGMNAVSAVVEGMDRVRQRVLTASSQVETLSDSLAQVDEILQLITEIAEQTDLLALNAAIEAARVGEHGKGFAVVAGEVRRLAERSRKAASDIAGRVENIRGEARGVVVTMEAGTGEVQVGTRLAREAGESLEGILRAVDETQRQVESISAAAEEISAAGSHVVEATHHLSAIAEENSATATQMLASARTVSDLVAEVEEGALSNRACSAEMAAAADTVRSGVEETVACAAQVSATSGKLREHVDRFRL